MIFHTPNDNSTGVSVEDVKKVWDALLDLDHFHLWPSGGALPQDEDTEFIYFPGLHFSLNRYASPEDQIRVLREASRRDVLNSMTGMIFDPDRRLEDEEQVEAGIDAILERLPTLPRFTITWSRLDSRLPTPTHSQHSRLIKYDDWVSRGFY